MIAAAINATVSARRIGTARALDTAVVAIAPPDAQHETPPPGLEVPLKGFQTVTVPALMPIAIPSVNLQERFDPKDFTGVGVEDGTVTGVAPVPDQVCEPSLLDDPPILLSSPPLDYPPSLRQAGIAGRVVVLAVIDTTGRAEPASVRVIQGAHPGFDQPSKQWMLNAQFRPARAGGRLVRVRINRALDYTIATAR
ncbi:MAG TPA: TonB family protein [Gemmatimonadales bacterium]|nr:TonB family protein [Gemmatimonadales bacterium]